jgi:hypothetical protein
LTSSSDLSQNKVREDIIVMNNTTIAINTAVTQASFCLFYQQTSLIGPSGLRVPSVLRLRPQSHRTPLPSRRCIESHSHRNLTHTYHYKSRDLALYKIWEAEYSAKASAGPEPACINAYKGAGQNGSRRAGVPTSASSKHRRNENTVEVPFWLPFQRQRPSNSNAMRTSASGVPFWLPFQRQRPPNVNAMKTLASGIPFRFPFQRQRRSQPRRRRIFSSGGALPSQLHVDHLRCFELLEHGRRHSRRSRTLRRSRARPLV